MKLARNYRNKTLKAKHSTATSNFVKTFSKHRLVTVKLYLFKGASTENYAGKIAT